MTYTLQVANGSELEPVSAMPVVYHSLDLALVQAIRLAKGRGVQVVILDSTGKVVSDVTA